MIYKYENDLPEDFEAGEVIAIDTETMGLHPNRDRLCVVQVSTGDGNAHIVRIHKDQKGAPVLKEILKNRDVLKLFHFGRFDIAVLANFLNTYAEPVYCTKIASKLVRTYTDKHGLATLTQELLGVDLNKQQQSSDWGAEVLTEEQLTYAASDVLYLHQIKAKLDEMLEREDRTKLAQSCFKFLSKRAQLDLAGWPEVDIFSH